jgi:hypothetical protein
MIRVVRMGKDPQHSIERALGHFANNDGFSAMRDRFESSQRSWASLREVRLLERQLDTVSWGLTDGASSRRAAFRRMVGDYEARYGIASVDALSVKRQRMLQANCRVYDLLNFATEMATHHAPPQAAARLHGWLGSTLTDGYELRLCLEADVFLEGTALPGPASVSSNARGRSASAVERWCR